MSSAFAESPRPVGQVTVLSFDLLPVDVSQDEFHQVMHQRVVTQSDLLTISKEIIENFFFEIYLPEEAKSVIFYFRGKNARQVVLIIAYGGKIRVHAGAARKQF